MEGHWDSMHLTCLGLRTGRDGAQRQRGARHVPSSCLPFLETKRACSNNSILSVRCCPVPGIMCLGRQVPSRIGRKEQAFRPHVRTVGCWKQRNHFFGCAPITIRTGRTLRKAARSLGTDWCRFKRFCGCWNSVVRWRQIWFGERNIVYQDLGVQEGKGPCLPEINFTVGTRHWEGGAVATQ